MTLEAGTRLGHYRLLGLLGRGGMADVYQARDERLGREVALKAVPPEFARDPERVERFEREVRAAAKLNHANIVTVYEYGQGEGLHFYTMALMRGGDLKSRIRASPGGMTPAEAAPIAAAVARALDYAHKRGFVHRDVKPENILFDEDGAPQLTDFGIARAMSEGTGLTKTGMSIGSPRYMSPEQARGLRVDGRSDVYSLGVVFYEMLTGQAPFDAEETLAVALAHVNDPVPPLPAVLSAWQPVVDRLLAKSPEDRFGSGAELAAVLSGAAPAASATRVMPVGGPVRQGRRGGEALSRPADAAGTPRTMRGRSQASAARRGLRAAAAGGALALVLAVVAGVALRGPGDSGGSAGPSGGDGTAVTEPPPQVSVLGGGALLVVATEPSGVEVLVDGEPLGETPLERADIRAGVREVVLRHPYYEPARLSGQSFVDGVVLRIERRLVRGSLRSGGSGPELVVIPAGSFRMGCVSGVGCYDDERPVHSVTIREAFAVGRYEVTSAEWDACVSAGGCSHRPSDRRGRDRPVVNVSWEDAREYVRWLSSETGSEYRLLSESEWEYAARAGASTAYSWGNRIGRGRAHCDGCSSGWGQGATAPVGSFSANGFGLHDMHGNVWEWVEDCRNESYIGAPSDGSAWSAAGCSRRVFRGGSWVDRPVGLRSAKRGWSPAGHRDRNIGFRVARTLTP